MEVQDFMKDLYDWEDEVKAKDKKLAKGEGHSFAIEDVSGENCPPIRGSAKFEAKEAPADLRGPSPKLSGTGTGKVRLNGRIMP